jgi:hypothetical protein
MWSLIKWLALRVAAVRWLFKSVGGFALLVPIAFLLKLIGLPVMMVLAVLALPVLFILFIFGLPIFLVMAAGGMVMTLLFALLSIGIVALKVAVLVVLPALLFWKIVTAIWGRGRGRRKGGGTDDADSGGSASGPETGPIDGGDSD